jgi:hypothetical protein
MRFHFTSFALGVGVGVAAVVLGRHLKPVFIEVATAAFEVSDAVAARVAMVQEDFEDMVAEARERARQAAGMRASA